MTAEPGLLALDFDGVICDSAHESAFAAWHALSTLWPGFDDAPGAEFLEAYRRLRPVIETGWENYVLARLIVDGVDEGEILDGFRDRLCPAIMERYGLRPATLSDSFGRARDEWRAADREAWLDCQPLYEGVPAMLARNLDSDRPLYVITTKAERFAAAILAHHGVVLPEGRLLGLETGPKTDSLARLAREHGLEPEQIWFVEDRLATLERVLGVEALRGIGLFLVDWGYNTGAERARAAADPYIEVLDLARFTGPLARWRAGATAPVT